MNSELPTDFFLEASPMPGKDAGALMASAWPNYLVERSDLPDPLLKVTMSLEETRRRNRTWSIRRQLDNRLVACAYALVIHADPSANSFPDSGWRFAVEAVTQPNPEPNCLCLIAVNVDSEYRGFHFPTRLIEVAKAHTRKLGFSFMLVPLRPTQKHEFPFLPMEEYLEMRNDDGSIFDPWIRTHVKAGAEVLNVCAESVVVKASLGKWREWTKLPLRESGEAPLPLGLAPLHVNIAQNLGVYREPNVWVRYRL